MSNSTNKNYNLQATGSNVGTWGTVLNNSVFSIIDANLGGTLAINVAGNSNINLTAAQTQNLIHNLTGVLTGNINYVFPAQGGFFAINNQTTGSFTVTVTVVGGSGGIIVPQGTASTVYIDATVPAVYGFTGTQTVYTAVSVGGTANAITVPSTLPANFSLITGELLTLTPGNFNTTSVTLTTPDGSTKTIQKVTFGGLANLVAEDIIPGLPIILQYNGTVWIAISLVIFGRETTVSTSQSLGFANNLTNYVNTAAVTYTIAQTTTMTPIWYVDINALGGTVTLTPNAADSINVTGRTLSAGASYKIPQGASCRLSTDANGNLFIGFLGDLLNTEFTIASATTTDLGASPSNIVAISGTTTITSLGSSASLGNPLYFIRFTGALTFTYNSTSLILPSAVNINTSSGDTAIAKYEGSGNWRIISYTSASGAALFNQSNQGGFLNKFRNGSMEIAQRGTTGTITAGSPVYTLDGFIINSTGGNITWSQSGGIYESGKGLQLTGAAGVTDTYIKQRIESLDAAPLQGSGGQQVTFQARVFNNTGSTVTPTLTVNYASAMDNFSSVSSVLASTNLQTIASGGNIIVSYTFPSAGLMYQGTEVILDFGASLNSGAKTIITSDWDIRYTPGVATGLNSNPPLVETRNKAFELLYNQRYLPAYNATTSSSTYLATGACYANSSGSMFFYKFDVPTRIPVTGLIATSTFNNNIFVGSTSPTSATATLTFNSASIEGCLIQATASTGISTAQVTFLSSASSTAQLLFIGAEL